MKAVIYYKYGTIEQLRIEDVDTPIPNESEIRIKIYAVSINDWDLGLLKGEPFVNRMISGVFKPSKKILGSDIAGVVDYIGSNVTKYSVGDKVYGDLSDTWGGFAEYVCTTADKVHSMPEGMGFEEAAAIPQAAMLAVQGLIDEGMIQTGQKLLINGAGGGVGTYGIQFAKHCDMEVTGVDIGSKLQMLKDIGYDHVIDYKKVDFTQTGNLYDIILDTKTNRPTSKYLKCLKPGGSYIIVGGDFRKLLKPLVFSKWISKLSGMRIRVVMLKTNKDLPYINDLFKAGRLKSIIDEHRFTLEETKEAMKFYESSTFHGKVVITVCNDGQEDK
ncbi:MAG: NAD(P)-dependent alcohol dehydrogenase [Clostridiaceae bacterium]|nr:NAD(P)-dependent alcohol dehydrogenase [Clostridiaceae bacterium]